MEELSGRLSRRTRVGRRRDEPRLSRRGDAARARGRARLERGRVFERLGDREGAIAGYSLVVEAWRHADPELKAYVDEARAALARLGGEKRPT